MCVEPVCLSEHHRLLGIKTGEELEHTRDTEDRREGQERDRGGAREGQGRGRREYGRKDRKKRKREKGGYVSNESIQTLDKVNIQQFN